MKRVAKEKAICRRNRKIVVAGTQNIITIANHVIDEDTVHNLLRIRHFVIDTIIVAVRIVGVVVNKVLVFLDVAYKRAVDKFAVASGLNHPVGRVVGLCDVVRENTVCDRNLVLVFVRELQDVTIIPRGVSFEPARIDADYDAVGGCLYRTAIVFGVAVQENAAVNNECRADGDETTCKIVALRLDMTTITVSRTCLIFLSN